jgi:hypothetical protein
LDSSSDSRVNALLTKSAYYRPKREQPETRPQDCSVAFAVGKRIAHASRRL